MSSSQKQLHNSHIDSLWEKVIQKAERELITIDEKEVDKEAKLGNKCQMITYQIEYINRQDTRLKLATLWRMHTRAKYDRKFENETLNLLAHFIGFVDFEDFKNVDDLNAEININGTRPLLLNDILIEVSKRLSDQNKGLQLMDFIKDEIIDAIITFKTNYGDITLDLNSIFVDDEYTQSSGFDGATVFRIIDPSENALAIALHYYLENKEYFQNATLKIGNIDMPLEKILR